MNSINFGDRCRWFQLGGSSESGDVVIFSLGLRSVFKEKTDDLGDGLKCR